MIGFTFLIYYVTNFLIYFHDSKEIIGPIAKVDNDIIEKGIKKLSKIFQMKDYLNFKSNSTQFLKDSRNLTHLQTNESTICKICQYSFSKIHNFLKEKYGMSWIIRLVTWLCSWGIKYDVCKGSIDLFESRIVDSLIEHYFNYEYICSGRYYCNSTQYIELNPDDYARILLEDKPNKTHIKEYEKKNNKNINKSIKVLHITDLHTDFLYKEGSWGACNEYVCCRNLNGRSPTKEEAAGRWGFVGNCDLPIITTYHFLDHIKNTVNPDLIVWTGDSNSHSVWNSTQQETISVITLISTLMKDYFNFTIPIYPAIGNHEFFPVDEFNPFNKTDNFVTLNLTGTLWKDWIGEEAFNKYMENGYYSVYNKDLNLRVISMNTMDCDTINFNLIRNPTDPANQFEWMEHVMRTAEANGEYIYIIGHIPPGDSNYLSQCSKRYNALIDRFSYIIKGQFFGHTHYDEFRVIHEYFNKTNIAGIIFSAPSITTYSNRMPSFRVYDVNCSNNELLDYTQYYLNITKANLNPDEIPTWELQYIATKDFKLKSLMDLNRFYEITQEIRVMLKLIKTNDEILQSILLKFYSSGPDYENFKHYKSKFNEFYRDIQNYISCRFEKDAFDDYFKCSNYRTWDTKEYATVFLEYLSGNWYKKQPEKAKKD